MQLYTRHRSESSLSAVRSGTLDTTDEAVESRNRRVQLRKQLRDAILVAAKAHVREVKAAAKGQDVDRHLYALLCLARTNGEDVPDLYQTEAWRRLNHTVLSTSNCGNPSLRLFGFGPVSPDGYGLGYIIKDGALSFCAASKNRQTSRYLGMLKKTHRLFRSVLASPEVSTPKRIRKKTIMMSAGYGFFDSGKIEYGSGPMFSLSLMSVFIFLWYPCTFFFIHRFVIRPQIDPLTRIYEKKKKREISALLHTVTFESSLKIAPHVTDRNHSLRGGRDVGEVVF